MKAGTAAAPRSFILVLAFADAAAGAATDTTFFLEILNMAGLYEHYQIYDEHPYYT